MVYKSFIGAEVKRKEDPHLLTGKATYVSNLTLPGMRYVAFVRSPHAHAKINGIDPSAALKRPGVLTVVTGQDLVEHYGPMPMGSAGKDSKPHTHYALSVERVRHVGEAVAAVIATDPAIAEDAIADVAVDWEPLPAVVDLEAAIKADAPRLFEDTSNIEHVWAHKAGDVESAFANAHRVVRQRITSQRLAAVPMEGRAVVVSPDPTSEGLTIWSSTQTAHELRSALSTLLHLPENMIRAVAPDVGGGFGVKIGIYPEELVLAALARMYRYPLGWTESRLEHMQSTTHGRSQVAVVEAAVQEDGTMTALRLRVLGDIGAYPVINFLPMLTGLMSVGVYRIPAVDLECSTVFTNTVPVAAYRGAGRPEAAYYIERLIDLAAGELGIDPAEMRRKNFIQPNQFPYKSPTGLTYDSGEYERALSKTLELAHYSDLRAEQEKRRKENSDRLLGIGISSFVEICGPGPYESAVVRVEPTGTVTVFTGISPHGQGQGTTFAQIVADQIGADFDNIVVKHGDTAAMPMGIGTFGSRGLAVGGSALMHAAVEVREKACQIAAHILEAAPEDIVLENGRYQVRGVPDRGLSLPQIAKRAYSERLPENISSGLEATNFFRPPDSVFPFGTHVAVVEVERETGIVHLRAYYTVDDCGTRISPLLVEGQVHGGLAQGIGQALWEEVSFDEHGQLLTGSLIDYAMPRADNFPEFVTGKTETPTPNNPLGAKGVGEAGTIGSTPAVVNAVMDALKPLGINHLDMPLRPSRIWQAISSAS